MTPEQYTFIRRKPNSSEFFRAIFDIIMQIDDLMDQRSRKQEQADEYIGTNTWNNFELIWDESVENLVLKLDAAGEPIPKGEGGRVLLELRRGVTDEIEAINGNVEKLLERLRAELLCESPKEEERF